MVRTSDRWKKTLSFPQAGIKYDPEEMARLSQLQKQASMSTTSPRGQVPVTQKVDAASVSMLRSKSTSTNFVNCNPPPVDKVNHIIRDVVRIRPKSTSPNVATKPICPDPESEKAIMGSVVYCIHHKEGCKWTDELRKLKGHLNTCKHDSVPCPRQCGALIPRVLIEDHLHFTCPQRAANCEFCEQEFTGQTLENHSGSCGLEPVYCENKCGQKVQRRHLNQHKTAECSKRLVPCRYCKKEFVADTLQTHHSKCGRFPVACPNHCDTSLLVREELEVHLREQCPSLVMACAFKEAGCRYKGPRYGLEKHLDENTKQHLVLMCSLVTKQQHQINTMRTALAKVSINHTGTLLWKINDYASHMNEAKSKEGLELVSAPFYTSQYGYKLQASLFLNGNGAGDNSHLSIYIKILPGEYDALLKWPFSHTVSFTLYDQSTVPDKACNIVESFIPDPTWKNFQRPSREPDSLGFGFPRFITHDTMKKRHYIRDDTIFVRVRVDPSKIVAV